MLTCQNESCKDNRLTRLATACAAVAALLLSACVVSTGEPQSFRVRPSANVESAQIATDADFGRYDRLLATGLGIYFPQSYLTTDEDLQRIRQTFREAFLAQLDGYAIVSRPGPSTMTVEASLVDLRNAGDEQIPHMRSDIRELAKPGSILFLMEMRDSQSNRVLARAADSAAAPVFSTNAGTTTDWASIESAAQRWAALFRAFLDDNLTRQ